MGLLKRMLSRGLAGAESEEPWSEPPKQNVWPPDPPPTSPPIAPWQPPDESLFGLEKWRYPVALKPKELAEQGFERAGTQIQAAFKANNQTLNLTHNWTELAVNDVRFAIEANTADVDVRNTVTGETCKLEAAVWAVAVALHDAYVEPLDRDRTWQLALASQRSVLFLARPEELPAIARRPELETVLELGNLQPV